MPSWKPVAHHVALIWGYKYKWSENIRITGLKVWLVRSFII